jgi:hypothetical protein
MPKFILRRETHNYLGMIILVIFQAHQTCPASTCSALALEGETRKFNTISLRQGSSS